jgi:hypothetical protein
MPLSQNHAITSMADDDYISRKDAKQLVDDLRKEYQTKLHELRGECDDVIGQLRAKLSDERKLRLHETDRLVGLVGGFRFLVVPRPQELNKKSIPTKNKSTWHVDPDNGLDTLFDFSNHTVTHCNKQGESFQFQFNYVLQPSLHATQHLWDECGGFVDGVYSQPPRHLLMLAHGRTGSGKTHIMAEKEHGMIPRTLARIFDLKEKHTADGHSVQIEALSVHVYEGKCSNHKDDEFEYLHDKDDKQQWNPHYPKHDQPGTQPPFPRHELESLKDALDFFDLVRKQRERSTSKTAKNDRSSRSHLVVAFFVTTRHGGTGEPREGSIHLADLAGNEEQPDSTQAQAERQDFTKELNELGNVLPVVHRRSKQNAAGKDIDPLKPANTNVSDPSPQSPVRVANAE